MEQIRNKYSKEEWSSLKERAEMLLDETKEYMKNNDIYDIDLYQVFSEDICNAEFDNIRNGFDRYDGDIDMIDLFLRLPVENFEEVLFDIANAK